MRPKPMVEVGGKPMLWHIMKIYAWHGIKDFIIACGYKARSSRSTSTTSSYTITITSLI